MYSSLFWVVLLSVCFGKAVHAESSSSRLNSDSLTELALRDASASLGYNLACTIENGASEGRQEGLSCWRRSQQGWISVDLEDKEIQPDVYVQVSCSPGRCCALTNKGHAQCWDSEGNLKQTFSPRNSYIQVSLGDEEACAIRAADLHLECHSIQQRRKPTTSAPQGDSRFGQVSCGKEHCCAVDISPQGRIFCWGANDRGQLQVPSGKSFSQVATANGGSFSVGIERGTGLVYGWGEDGYGQIATVPKNQKFIHVACGAHFACGLTHDVIPQIKCWGKYSGLLVEASLAKLKMFSLEEARFLTASSLEVCIGDATGSLRSCLPWQLEIPPSRLVQPAVVEQDIR